MNSNIKLKEYKEYIKNKKVAVLGIGVSNLPLIKYLADLGVNITAFDKSQNKKNELSGTTVNVVTGEKYLDNINGFDIIFKTPGMRHDIPELIKAKNEGAIITSEMEVFFELCPAEILAVTGSDGKTTTTTLIYNMLCEEGYKCWLGGNIGTPLLSKIDEINENDKVILELSSFQLHTMKKSPSIAIITNITPNHLDIHKSMDEYIEAKKNIFKYQNEGNRVILNCDNDVTKSFESLVVGKLTFFSRVNNLKKGVLLKDGVLKYIDENREIDIIRAQDILIPGVHNVENYLAAIAAVIDYVKPETIRRVAVNFGGVAHRIELVREVKGVKFYNDSIASSPTRTIAGLNSFNQKVILIAGGYDKKIPYDVMGSKLLEKVKCLILIGQTAPKIEKALLDEIESTGNGKEIDIIKCTTLEEAVHKAYIKAIKDDIVILSPASASFDMFTNFEERGNKFKEIVKDLKDI